MPDTGSKDFVLLYYSIIKDHRGAKFHQALRCAVLLFIAA